MPCGVPVPVMYTYVCVFQADVTWRRSQHISASGDSVLELRGWTAARSHVDERVAERSMAAARGEEPPPPAGATRRLAGQGGAASGSAAGGAV